MIREILKPVACSKVAYRELFVKVMYIHIEMSRSVYMRQTVVLLLFRNRLCIEKPATRTDFVESQEHRWASTGNRINTIFSQTEAAIRMASITPHWTESVLHS